MVRLLIATLLAIIIVQTGAAETLSGEMVSFTIDHTDGVTATESPLVEDGERRVLIIGPLQAKLLDLRGRKVVLNGTYDAPAVFQAQSILSVEPRSLRSISSEESRLTLLVGVFDIGSSLSGPATNDEIKETLLTHATLSTAKLFEVNSYGTVTIQSVETASRTTLSIALPTASESSGCYPWYNDTFLPAARAAFSAQGFTYTDYDRVLYVLPSDVGSECGFAGLAISARESFYSGAINPTLALHELGHNSWPASGHGFSHASSDPDNDGVKNQEYGDNFDAMGISGYFYNLLHEEKAHWFTQAGGQIRTISADGVTEIDLPSVELHPRDATSEQRVNILLPGDSRPYVLTYRKMVGTFDSGLYDAYVDDRINLHRVPLASSYNTLVIGEAIEGNAITPANAPLLVEFLEQSEGVARVRITIGTLDSDGDGVPNESDLDDDSDGVPDVDDCSPTISTRWTNSAYLDQDNDGIVTSRNLVTSHVCVGSASGTGYSLTLSDQTDNCPLISNADQLDTDIDGSGDACDSATDGPTLSMRSRRYNPARRQLTIKLAAIGLAAVPYVDCALKPPQQSSYLPRSFYRRGRSTATTASGTCIVPIRRGVNTIRIRACEGTSCAASFVTYRARR